MAWTAIVTALTPRATGVETQVVISDESTKFFQDYVTDGSSVALRARVRQTIRDLEARPVKQDVLVGHVVDLTPDPPPPDPTPAELARIQFDQDYRRLQRRDQAIVSGLLQQDDRDTADLRASVQAKFLPEYLT